MDQSDAHKSLFQDFEPVSTQAWEAVIQQDLKGADYEKKLIWKTLEGISVKPYYRSEDLEGVLSGSAEGNPLIRSKDPEKGNAWKIHQQIQVQEPGTAVKKLARMLERGVESVGLAFSDQPGVQDLVTLFKAIPLERVPFWLSGADPELALDALDQVCGEQSLDKTLISGSLGWDVFSHLMRTGRVSQADEQLSMVPEWTERLEPYPAIRLLEVNAVPLRQAGSTLVQELGLAASMWVDYMDRLTDMGVSAEWVATRMSVRLAVGSNYFFELAKFRATRLIWARILEAFGIDPVACPARIHAESSSWNKTIYDPHVNLLRTTTEAMSAILGGADSLCVLPFNAVYQEPDEFSERLARNQQIILREEAYLDKVIDPASGSYYVEVLTAQLAAEAWKVFAQAEERDGFTEAFLDGWIQDAVVTIAQQKDQRIAQRRDTLLGTNQYPNSQEQVQKHIRPDLAFQPVVDPTGADAQPLIPYRGAEGFERLRLATEKAAKRPKVFLLPIGHPVMRKARATFAANFFACAGYEIVEPTGFSDVAAGMQRAAEVQADIIVLCSSDDEYAEIGRAAAQTAPQAELVIAGYPADHIPVLEEAGIRHFIHVKTHVLECLQGFNELLGLNK